MASVLLSVRAVFPNFPHFSSVTGRPNIPLIYCLQSCERWTSQRTLVYHSISVISQNFRLGLLEWTLSLQGFRFSYHFFMFTNAWQHKIHIHMFTGPVLTSFPHPTFTLKHILFNLFTRPMFTYFHCTTRTTEWFTSVYVYIYTLCLSLFSVLY